MKIPKYISRKDREYEFVKKCSDNMFLYKNIKTGSQETFTLFDLHLIDNTEIDKKLRIFEEAEYTIKVYDRLYDTETVYNTAKDAAAALEISYFSLLNHLNNKRWILNRWYASKEMKEG